MSKGRVLDFLISLSKNASKNKQFVEDPKKVIKAEVHKKTGFTAEEAKLLASRDREKMAKFLEMDNPPDLVPQPPHHHPPKKG
jgi:hypothetical protein